MIHTGVTTTQNTETLFLPSFAYSAPGDGTGSFYKVQWH